MSNPRGTNLRNRIKQNSEISETVDAMKKGRSKSRRQAGTHGTTAVGHFNTKTMEGYTSGVIDRQNRPHIQRGHDYQQPQLVIPF
jgi:hypothetical protein